MTDTRVANGWVEHAIWWHVYPLGFAGAPIRPQADDERTTTHRLGRVTAWLDYVIQLGCNGLVLGPVFDSLTHGYDTTDHFRIDPRLGTDADFDELVAAAHARGVKIVLDGVFNHVGRAFPRWLAARDGDEEAAAWFAAGNGGPAVFEGHDDLLALNHDCPQVASYVADVMRHWLARGIDGWRLDAAYAIAPQFWARVLPKVRAEYPKAWFLGEMIHGDYAHYVAASGLDSVTQYELWKAIWSSVHDQNLYELSYALGRHQAFASTFVPYTFVGNHDVTRIATQVGDPRHLTHTLAVLMTVPGTPAIYAGDEQGLRAIKEEREGGDDAIRPAFPETPGILPGGDARTLRDHQRLIGLRRREPWLARGRLAIVHLDNRALVYTVRPRGLADGGPGGIAEQGTTGGHGGARQQGETCEPGAAPTRAGDGAGDARGAGGQVDRRIVVALNLGDQPLDVEGALAAGHQRAVPQNLTAAAADLAPLGPVQALRPEGSAPGRPGLVPGHEWAVFPPAP